MSPAFNRQVRLTKRADGIPAPENFLLEARPLPDVPDGGVLVKVLYASVDPAMRGWVSDEHNYLSVPTGDVMRANGVGEVVQSLHPAWKIGDCVFGWFGWQQYAAASAEDLLWKIDLSVAPATAWLSVLGLNGLTAWIGLCHLARARAGETVLVSTAAGGVGGVVGQLAEAIGLRAVGLTGSDDKVSLARDELGYADALNYKDAGGLSERIGGLCPNGINIFFDNTGGEIADAVFPHLATGARVIQCGTASVSSWTTTPQGPRREREMLVRRLSWQGFVVTDHAALFPQALAELTALFSSGQLRAYDHVLEGLEQAPDAIGLLYRGENTGRLLLRP